MSNLCKTCKYADFPLTPTGRFRRGVVGTCTASFDLPPIPTAVVVRWSRMGIWPDDGAGCQTHDPVAK